MKKEKLYTKQGKRLIGFVKEKLDRILRKAQRGGKEPDPKLPYVIRKVRK